MPHPLYFSTVLLSPSALPRSFLLLSRLHSSQGKLGRSVVGLAVDKQQRALTKATAGFLKLVAAVETRNTHGLPHPHPPDAVLTDVFFGSLGLVHTLRIVSRDVLERLPAAVVPDFEERPAAPSGPLNRGLANGVVGAALLALLAIWKIQASLR